MTAPLALAAPAAIAALSYLNAKTSFGYDRRLFGAVFKSQFKMARRVKNDRLSMFYVLEDHALGKHGNDTFFIFEGRQWTYKEAYQTALKYGAWLKKKYDIKPKEVVAMDFMNSDKFILIWMGLWAIGAKPAFINYNLTGKALAHCIKISTSRIIFVDAELRSNITQEVRDELPDLKFEVFGPELEAEIMATDGVREPNSVRSEDKTHGMAILIYTSGTTGLPKGAIVSWQKIIVGTGFVPSWMEFTRKDILYTCMPLYHTAGSVLGFCTCLASGATLSLGKKFSTKTFWPEVVSTKATAIQYVGETCRYLLSAPPSPLDKTNLVRLAFGNGLRPDIWNRFKERFGIEAVAEFYSATEGASGTWNYSKNDFSRGAVGRVGSFGQLVTGSTTAIVEMDFESELPYRDPSTGFCKAVPKGSPGELLYKLDADDVSIKFQGYYNNPSSTESKILRNVLTKGDAYFRTGDIMSYDSEGRTYFNDRIGDTFRWKSENVSTSEVSECLGLHPRVVEANVYGVEIPHHDGRAGCVAVVLEGKIDDGLMRELARWVERLPRFARPVFVRVVKGEMVITGTNKQLKHVVRKEGVDPEKVGQDELWWLKGNEYVRFGKKEWEDLSGGAVKL